MSHIRCGGRTYQHPRRVQALPSISPLRRAEAVPLRSSSGPRPSWKLRPIGLTDPRLELSRRGKILASNDNWQDSDRRYRGHGSRRIRSPEQGPDQLPGGLQRCFPVGVEDHGMLCRAYNLESVCACGGDDRSPLSPFTHTYDRAYVQTDPLQNPGASDRPPITVY